MSSFTKKYNDEEMNTTLGELLMGGEHLETAILCYFEATGFLTSHWNMVTGYAGITDRGRFVLCKHGLISDENTAYNMDDIVQKKIKPTILGQKKITMVFDDGKKHTVKFLLVPKDMGSKFPNQEQNAKKMLDILEAKQNKMSDERPAENSTSFNKADEKTFVKKGEDLMFSALEACDFDKIRNFFEYIEIDDESRKVLGEYGIENKNEGKLPEKWCVNVDRQIAFLELEYVSSIIVRTDNSECYRVCLFAVHDGYGTISFYHQEGDYGSITSPSVHYKEGWDHSKLTEPVLLTLLEEAMKARQIDDRIDIHYHKLMSQAECLKSTQVKISHGVFPTILQEMFHSITELADAELRFRSACLKHFVEQDIRQQRYNGVYLDDDEDSFFILDFLFWAYLHISSSMEQLKHDWDNIVNQGYKYEYFFGNHFRINVEKEYFFEKYMGKRMEEGIIVLLGDEIRFVEGYSETIINHFK